MIPLFFAPSSSWLTADLSSQAQLTPLVALFPYMSLPLLSFNNPIYPSACEFYALLLSLKLLSARKTFVMLSIFTIYSIKTLLIC